MPDPLVAAAAEFRVALTDVRRTDVQGKPNDDSTATEFASLLKESTRLLGDGRTDDALRLLRRWHDRPVALKSSNQSLLIKAIEEIETHRLIIWEFSQKPLVISGVLSDGYDRAVIINRECFADGEYIDADTFVKEVGRKGIAFVYKGFTLVKVL